MSFLNWHSAFAKVWKNVCINPMDDIGATQSQESISELLKCREQIKSVHLEGEDKGDDVLLKEGQVHITNDHHKMECIQE